MPEHAAQLYHGPRCRERVGSTIEEADSQSCGSDAPEIMPQVVEKDRTRPDLRPIREIDPGCPRGSTQKWESKGTQMLPAFLRQNKIQNIYINCR